jgi:hypothetical protein
VIPLHTNNYEKSNRAARCAYTYFPNNSHLPFAKADVKAALEEDGHHNNPTHITFAGNEFNVLQDREMGICERETAEDVNIDV